MARRKAVAKKARKKAVKKKARKEPFGRPLKYTVSQAQRLIDEYFQTCDDTKTPYTITNLALALDTSRRSLCNWAERGDELSVVIKRAKQKVEAAVELLLLEARNPAGAIFWLKNFGWTDRQEIVGAGGSPLIPAQSALLADIFTLEELKDIDERIRAKQNPDS
ncbi:DNA-packaging protein [Acidobacteria bacterium AH-259-D05]|nr:DNA-packaging protein [Acidobacteria bacterium AH-259-D05]